MSIFKYLTLSHLQKVLAALETRFSKIENDITNVSTNLIEKTKDIKKGDFIVETMEVAGDSDLETRFYIKCNLSDIKNAYDSCRDIYIRIYDDLFLLQRSNTYGYFYFDILFNNLDLAYLPPMSYDYSFRRYIISKVGEIINIEYSLLSNPVNVYKDKLSGTISYEWSVTPEYNDDTGRYEIIVDDDLWDHIVDNERVNLIFNNWESDPIVFDKTIALYDNSIIITANPDDTVLISTAEGGTYDIELTVNEGEIKNNVIHKDYLRSFQSDWEEEDMGNTRYIDHRPAIRAGDGKSSIVEGRIVPIRDVCTLKVTGDANSTTYTFTTEDDISTLNYSSVSGGTIFYNNNHYAISSLTKNPNTFTVVSTLSKNTALTNTEVKLYYQSGNVAFGDYTHSEGSNTTATRLGAHSEGQGTRAMGHYSHAEGFGALAEGMASHSEGYKTNAKANYSHSEGSNTVASGLYSHSEGSYTTASGQYSHAEGNHTEASGQASHAEGIDTKASGNLSHVEGYFSVATRPGSHAEGWNGTSSVTLTGEANTLTYTVTDGPYLKNVSRSIAMAVEYNDTIYPITSIVLNTSGILTSITLESTLSDSTAFSSTVSIHIGNLASGNGAHAEGNATHAMGVCSHTEGLNTIASDCAHAEGTHTLASSSYQHVQGKFNVEDSNNVYAHIVGNGTEVNARSNAHTLDWSGNAWYAGKVSAGTVVNPANPTAANDLATKAYVDDHAGVTTLFGLTDTTITSASDGQILTYDNTNSKWINSNIPKDVFLITATATYNSAAPGLFDYTFDKTYNEITTAYNAGKICLVKYGSEYYYYEGETSSNILFLSFYKDPHYDIYYINTFVITSSNNVSRYNFKVPQELADLKNVSIQSPYSGQSLIYSSNGNWTNGRVALTQLSDTTISSPTDGQVLTYDSTTSKWININTLTETRVNELIAAALAQYGDGDTASYGYTDASEVNY